MQHGCLSWKEKQGFEMYKSCIVQLKVTEAELCAVSVTVFNGKFIHFSVVLMVSTSCSLNVFAVVVSVLARKMVFKEEIHVQHSIV